MLAATGVIIKKKGSADKKAVTLSGYLTSGAIFAFGRRSLSPWHHGFALAEKISAIRLLARICKYIGLGYPVMCLVIGSLAIVGAVIFMIMTARKTAKRSKPKPKGFVDKRKNASSLSWLFFSFFFTRFLREKVRDHAIFIIEG
jgi:hypothetical protein